VIARCNGNFQFFFSSRVVTATKISMSGFIAVYPYRWHGC